MIYNVANTIDGEYGPTERVVDANGLEYTHTLEVDTETGRIEQYKTDDNGKVVISENGEEPVRETVFAAPPLVVIFRNA